MISHILDSMVVIYFGVALIQMTYGINCYVMIYLFRRRQAKAAECVAAIEERFPDLLSRPDLPVVTTQIPVFNELNVIERVMRAACAMQYPKELHEIQVLDDSTDETSQLIDHVVADLRSEGHDICALRRKDRIGYKAGALAYGLRHSRGSLVAVFDADFVPGNVFWLRILPHFLDDPKLGLVQARWGHLNRTHSLLTRAQGMGIDGHFMVEQSARAWNDLFMNFNGTAGAWRVSAIEEAGGWEWDTLTEDMDLSYRMQLSGWGVRYLSDLIVPAEIPEEMGAFKSQQFRWAKGSIQTAIKLFPRLWRSRDSRFKKLQAGFHLTHYLIHPLMLILAVLALPVLLHLQLDIGPSLFTALAICLGLSMMAPSTLYVVSQRAAYADWFSRVLLIPALVVVGVGVALNNARGVSEALLGIKSGFVRTPKRGDHEKKQYRVCFPWLGLFELLLGLYCALSLHCYLLQGRYLIGPFLAIYAAGFLFVGSLTLAHAAGVGRRTALVNKQ